MSRRHREGPRGQTLVETALVLPVLLVIIFGIVIFGLGVFAQQQLANGAREAARYAAIHSATSQCPTTSWLTPNLGMLPPEFDLTAYYNCDPPNLRWPEMTAFARSKVFGLNRSAVHFSACWSGYWDGPSWDAAALSTSGAPNRWRDCTIAGIDPRLNTTSLTCPAPITSPSDDQASNLAASSASTANQVTVYACYDWRPPLGGLSIPVPCANGWCSVSILPAVVPLKAVVTEPIQHQR